MVRIIVLSIWDETELTTFWPETFSPRLFSNSANIYFVLSWEKPSSKESRDETIGRLVLSRAHDFIIFHFIFIY